MPKFVDDLIPPILLRPAQRAWRRLHGLGWTNFHGSWPGLADVPVTRGMDDTDPWAQTIRAQWRENLEAAAATAGGDASDLMLPLLALQFTGPLTVLDFGGGPGVGLVNIRRFTRLEPSRLRYVLVETPAMCRAVRNEIETRGGQAMEDIPDAVPSPLIVNAGSSLQYVADYRDALSRLTRLAPNAVIVSQTPMSERPTYARQVLNTPHEKLAAWVFNRAEFTADMRSCGYRLAFSADHDLPLTHGQAPGPSIMASMVFLPETP